MNRAREKLGMRRWIGRGLTGAGALAVVALMALAPAAASSLVVPGLHNATPIHEYANNVQGCAKSTVLKPTISMATGIGKTALKDSAITCPKAKGGAAVTSLGEAEAVVGFQSIYKVTAASTMATVNYSVKAMASDSGVGTVTSCPTTTYSGSYASGNGTAFYNESFGYCTSQGLWEYENELIVCVAGTSVCSYGFSFTSNTSGNYDDIFLLQYNYSNPYIGTNATYNYSSSHNYGTSNSTSFNSNVSITASGSWPAGTKLSIESLIFIITEAYVQHETGGKTAAAFNAAPAVGHVDLLGVSVV